MTRKHIWKHYSGTCDCGRTCERTRHKAGEAPVLQTYVRLRCSACGAIVLAEDTGREDGKTLSADEGPTWLVDRESAAVVFDEVDV